MINKIEDLPDEIRLITPYMCWGYGNDDWVWSEDSKCYIVKEHNHVPKSLCLGERYAHASHGLDSFGICWQGGPISDWHGWAGDMGEAIKWVQEATRPDLGFILWSNLGKSRVEIDAEKYTKR